MTGLTAAGWAAAHNRNCRARPSGLPWQRRQVSTPAGWTRQILCAATLCRPFLRAEAVSRSGRFERRTAGAITSCHRPPMSIGRPPLDSEPGRIRRVMRYAMLVHADENAVVGDEERARREAAFARFLGEMRERGVLHAGERLRRAETATTVRCWDGGDIVIADGPLAETSEQIVGVFVVDCMDLDAAIETAARVPAAWYGTIEVRPVWET
jgi:hypothetical protein